MRCKRIFLKNVRKYVLVDSFIYSLIKDIGWYMHHTGYAYAKFGYSNQPMHRIVTMAPKGLCIDHINRNRLDNRLSNLRLCLKGNNSFNATIQRNNTSGFKGVHFYKKNKRWVAYIGKTPRVYLGSFSSSIEAARAYNKEAKIRFGNYAVLNEL